MARTSPVNIALIGQSFMGRAHSNAWTQVNRFCDPPRRANMHTVCARDRERLEAFAAEWGWRNTSTNWKKTVADDEIELVDIGVPNHLHLKMAGEVLKAGKAVACEKPLARTLEEGREMVRLARKAKVPTFVWYNYRRCPAVAFAHQLVEQGAIGEIRRVRGFYLQEFGNDPSVPLIWRFQKRIAGSGAHGDLCAHVIDMVRFVTGLELKQICGAMFETFVKQRPKLTQASEGGIAGGARGEQAEMGKVTVDDAVSFLARMDGGAMASFEATRCAAGHENANGFEINGTKGAIRFHFERMNELEYCDVSGDRATKGWRTIICTHEGDHPYAEAWWPDAHVIGYEHSFTHQAWDILRVLAGKKPIVPIPDFEDAYQTQRVLEAATVCAKEKRWVKLSEIK